MSMPKKSGGRARRAVVSHLTRGRGKRALAGPGSGNDSPVQPSLQRVIQAAWTPAEGVCITTEGSHEVFRAAHCDWRDGQDLDDLDIIKLRCRMEHDDLNAAICTATDEVKCRLLVLLLIKK